MTNKKLNIIFLILVTVSFFLVFTSFLAWNKQGEIDLAPPKKEIESKYWIDECRFENDQVFVSGWGFLKDRPYVRHEVYVIDSEGRYYKLNTRRNKRKDVVDFFGLGDEYINIGFLSGLRSMSGDFINKTVVVSIVSPYGEEERFEYNCR